MNEPVVPSRRRLPDWAWDLIAGVSVILTALLPYGGRGDGEHLPSLVVAAPWAVAVPVAAAVVLPFRRRHPVAVLGATVALLVIGALLVGSTFPFVLPVAIARSASPRGSSATGRLTRRGAPNPRTRASSSHRPHAILSPLLRDRTGEDAMTAAGRIEPGVAR